MNLELPQCRWRRQPTAPDRHVCISPRVRCNASGVDDDSCRSCVHVDHAPPDSGRRQCKHLGDLVAVRPLRILGRNDRASVPARVHQCGVHGECSPNTAHVELPCCMSCPDHADDWRRDQGGWVRHLTYHLYPAGPLWRWNVQELVRRISLFNGRRVVAIATDASSAPFAEAAELLQGLDVEVLPLNNEPARKELVSHVAMIEMLHPYRGDGDVTWYGHGKGAGSHIYGEGVRRWAQEMYSATLDYWPAVAAALRDHAAVGVFRRVMSPATSPRASWHYSGSFRWLRNKDLYRRNWRAIDPDFYGPETYPGRHFTFGEAACLYGEFAYQGVGLYLEQTWTTWAQAAADDWYKSHAADWRLPMLVTVILTAHAQPVRVHDALRSIKAQSSDSWQCLLLSSGRIPRRELLPYSQADARFTLVELGEHVDADGRGRGQGWAINEAWRLGLVRGDLVVHLSDDDVLSPDAVATWIRVAQLHRQQSAWYGLADRVRVHADGQVERLELLGLRGTLDHDHSGRRHVDGMQVCHRRSVRCDWPEDLQLAAEADGVWMEELAARTPIHPVEHVVGTHRHTPLSTFTR